MPSIESIARRLFVAVCLGLSATPGLSAENSAEIAELKDRVWQLESETAAQRRELNRLERLPRIEEASFAAESADLATLSADQKADGKQPEPPKPYEIGTDLAFKSRFKDGLFFETANGDYKAHVGALIQQDWAFFSQEQPLTAGAPIGVGNLQDSIFFRRGRLKFDGTAHELFEWDVDAELIANTNVAFDDMWVGMTNLPWVGNLRAGHVKIPMGLESVTSNRVFTFVERATIFDAFLPEYGPGLLAFDSLLDGHMTWAACFHRIDPTSNGTASGDGEYNGTFRTTCLPWCAPDDSNYLHLGAAYSHRTAVKDTVRFRARPEFRDTTQDSSLNNRFVDTGTLGADNFDLFVAELAWINGPLSFQAEECIADVNDVRVGANRLGGATFNGGYAMVSYFVTGEWRTYDHRLGRMARVRPHENFWVCRQNPSEPASGLACAGRGAWELAARYSWLNLNDPGINGGRLDDFTAGVNWYLNYNLRIQWNYVLAHRAVAAPQNSGDAHAFVMRFSFDI